MAWNVPFRDPFLIILLESFWEVFGQARNHKTCIFNKYQPTNDFDPFFDNHNILVRIRFGIKFNLNFETILVPPWGPVLVPFWTKSLLKRPKYVLDPF